MTTIMTQTDKTNSRNQKQDETDRLLKNRALLQKIRRHLNADHLVQMRNPDSGEYNTAVNVEMSGDQLVGYRDKNGVPWHGLCGDRVIVGNEPVRLNAKATTKTVDPCMANVDLVSAMNSMTDWRTEKNCRIFDNFDKFGSDVTQRIKRFCSASPSSASRGRS